MKAWLLEHENPDSAQANGEDNFVLRRARSEKGPARGDRRLPFPCGLSLLWRLYKSLDATQITNTQEATLTTSAKRTVSCGVQLRRVLRFLRAMSRALYRDSIASNMPDHSRHGPDIFACA